MRVVQNETITNNETSISTFSDSSLYTFVPFPWIRAMELERQGLIVEKQYYIPTFERIM